VSNINAFSQQLLPHLAGAINPEVAFPDPLYFGCQLYVPLDAIGQSIRIPYSVLFLSINIARRSMEWMPLSDVDV